MKKNLPLIIISILIFLALIIASFFVFKIEKTNSNANFASLDLAKLEASQAKNIILDRIEDINNNGIIYYFENQKYLLPSMVSAFDSELAYEIYFIDPQENIDLFFQHYKPSLLNNLSAFLTKEVKILKASYRFHQERWWQTLVSAFADIEQPAQNAYFFFEDGALKLSKEKYGLKIDREANLLSFKNHLENLSTSELELIIQEISPEIREKDLLPFKETITKFLENKEFKLNYKQESWPLDNNDLITWFTVSDNEFNLDKDKIILYLESVLAPKINQDAILPSFEVENNRILNWQAGKSGRELLIEENADLIKSSILNHIENIEIIVKETMGDDVEGLAAEIVEIIGTGHSNFAGSPSNRIHNIRVGAERYHGLIIPPHEEFSVLKNLGPVNRESGYLPELVIKNNQTIPEYGGGLCQVSTTLFRAALDTGLTITARQNHSYRVSYYEPAGTDAAIYNPWPDLKFINDTDTHIMIQARIVGSDLYFDFWGTHDGRQVSVGKPVIYNIVAPPPTKIIVNNDMAPGERRCTERAHNGANAYFDYLVEYANGDIKERRFNSYYVPWQEVCLVGPEKKEIEEIEDNEDEM